MEKTIFFHSKRLNGRLLNLVDIMKDTQLPANYVELAEDEIRKTQRTHTLCFRYENDILYITWAKCLLKCDTFSKKIGKAESLRKMDLFVNNRPRRVISRINEQQECDAEYAMFDHTAPVVSSNKFFYKYLPSCVAKTLAWHVERASRYYKLNKDTTVYIEGSAEKNNINNINSSSPRIRVALETTTNEILETA